jgi:predicted RNA-binding protein YlxR (DUF448 family)
MEGRAGRHQPLRTCVGCKAVRPKSELERLVLMDGRPVADPSGQMPGRGAYVCGNDECAGRARARLARALRADARGEQGKSKSKSSKSKSGKSSK